MVEPKPIGLVLLLLFCGCEETIAPISVKASTCLRDSDCVEGTTCHRNRCFAFGHECNLDGLVDPGEACDDGNLNDRDGCTNSCELALCGDGVVRLDLAIDAAGYEACDDGNTRNDDACTNACEPAQCGDGFVATGLGEDCEDNNLIDEDACTNNCRLAHCGDGIVRTDLSPDDPQFEACDDGNGMDNDACLGDCSLAICGDGVIRADLEPDEVGFEACDDGNASNEDGCLEGCRLARCGDGERHLDVEACDDGNENDGDECTNNCTLARCGDGSVLDGVEPCDDGNAVETDGCLSGCILPACGDGFVRQDITDPRDERYENCEPGADEELWDCGDDCRARPLGRRLAADESSFCLLRNEEVWCSGFDGADAPVGRLSLRADVGPVHGLLGFGPRFGICTVNLTGTSLCHWPGNWNTVAFAIPNGQPIHDFSVSGDRKICWVSREGTVTCASPVSPAPYIIENAEQIVDVLVGDCALTASGQMHCWAPGEPARRVARGLQLRAAVWGIDCGSRQRRNGWCLLDRDGDVWGLNDDDEAVPQRRLPSGLKQLAGSPCFNNDRCDDAFVARRMTCGLTEEGEVHCLRHYDGVARAVLGLPEIVEIEVEHGGACARGIDGSVWGWGLNEASRVQREDSGLIVETPRRLMGPDQP